MTTSSRVSIRSLRTYDTAAVLDAVRSCLEPLGGMSAFVRRGQTVLLKPNILFGAAPHEAITTHPSVVRAAAVLAKEAGARVIVGDSPGIGELSKAARKTGLLDVVEELDLSLADFSTTCSRERAENRVVKKITLAKAVADADVIITLPKLKTHVQMGFTGALKNQFGLVVGVSKAHYHYRLKTRDWLAAFLVDINQTVRPALAIMDGIVGMEGFGPSGGTPREIGALLASSDLTAVDVAACHLIGMDPASTPLVRAAGLAGYGATTLAEIDFAGDAWEALRVSDYEKVAEMQNILRLMPIPRAAAEWLQRHLAPRPRIRAELCTKCNSCHRGCPVSPSAINPMLPARKQVADERCIRCYCCHEFCPEKAVALQKTLLDRVLRISDRIAK